MYVLVRIPYILVQLYSPQAAWSLINHSDTLRLVCLIKYRRRLTEVALQGLSMRTHKQIYTQHLQPYKMVVPEYRESKFSHNSKCCKSSFCCCGLWHTMMSCHSDSYFWRKGIFLLFMPIIWAPGSSMVTSGYMVVIALNPSISLFPPVVMHICVSAAADKPHALYRWAVHLVPSYILCLLPTHPYSMHALFSTYPTPHRTHPILITLQWFPYAPFPLPGWDRWARK